MSTPSPDVLTRAAVEAWLRSLPAAAVVGWASCNNACPLACYLHAQGFPTAHVYPAEWSEWHDEDEDRWQPMPAWATAFVGAVDDAYDPPPYPDDIRRADQRPVTAAEALAVLTTLELPQEVSP